MKFAAIGLCLTLAWGCDALAAETPTGVWYLGGATNTPSGYAGAIVSLPGAVLGRGFAVRGTGIGGEYGYQGGVGSVKARYAGGDLALVYQSSGTWGWGNVSAGPQYVNTSLSPIDPSNKRRGGRWTASLQSDGELYAQAWRVGWVGQVGVSNGSYEAGVHVNHSLGSEMFRPGLSAAVQGDPTYRLERVGPTLDIQAPGALTVQVAAGAVLQQGLGTRGYVSLGLSHVF